LAAAGTVGVALVEGLTRPDRATSARSDVLETFTQVGGFVAIAVASVSAVLLVAGGGLVLADVTAVTAPAASAMVTPPPTP
jgi:NaMN:DMB phosphoribosyltransferase